MVLQIGSFGQSPSAGSPCDQHGVVRSDPAVRSGEPPQHIWLRCPTESIGTPRHHIALHAVREYEGVPGEFDDRMMITGHRYEHLDRPVDRREPPFGGVDQDAVKFVHSVRDYGRVMRADVTKN